MKLSKEARKNAKLIFKASLQDGRVDAGRVRTISTTLIEKKPRHYIGILKEFQRLIRLETAKHHALIESAVDLTSDSVNQITQDLRSHGSHTLTTEFKTNPSLLGGLRIRIGSDVVDGSVQGRLQVLEKNLLS